MHNSTKNTNAKGEAWDINENNVLLNPDEEILFLDNPKFPHLGNKVTLSIGYKESEESGWVYGYSISLKNQGVAVGCCIGLFSSKTEARRISLKIILDILKFNYNQSKIANAILASNAQTSLF